MPVSEAVNDDLVDRATREMNGEDVGWMPDGPARIGGRTAFERGYDVGKHDVNDAREDELREQMKHLQSQLEESEASLASYRESLDQELEWRAEREKHGDRTAARALANRKPKPLNRVVMDARFTVAERPLDVIEEIRKRYSPATAKSGFKASHYDVAGNEIWVRFDYTVCGGHPADVRRVLKKVTDAANVEVEGGVANVAVDVVSREPVEKAA